MTLNGINSPNSIKELSLTQLDRLSKEIRDAILFRSLKIGGHIASNLCVVELTIALHYVFNSPKDQFVFDCSHICYAHKILTGRAKGFKCEQYFDNIAGYTNPKESEHDIFEIGHTSTSLSLAAGLVISRDLKGEQNNVIAIIGDGALSGGEAFEGLNYIGGEIKSNCIIIVNDNNMSIAENHGGIYNNLKLLRETNGTADCNIFRSIGFDYMYISEGNDITTLINNFNRIKDIDHPIIIHINTTKGKGYELAEDNPEQFHYYLPNKDELVKYESYADVTRKILKQEIKKNDKIVYLAAATPALLPLSMGFMPNERKELGRNFIDVGIAEEHAVAMASAVASRGCKPVFSVMATFLQRAYDQIIHDLCINNNPALILVWDSGVYGLTDKTHLGHFDIQELAHIPNLLYLAPTCYEEYVEMLQFSINDFTRPIAIRIPSNGLVHTQKTNIIDFTNIEYEIVEKGEDVAIIALGAMFQLGEDISCLYTKQIGKKLTLINPRCVSQIDYRTLDNLMKKHKIIITLEDGILDGGWGQKIASYYGTSNIKVKNYGLKKEFTDRYNLYDILYDNRLINRLIVKDIIQLMENK